MPFLSINGVDLYYLEEGKKGETLVFGHSMLFNLHMFDQQVDYLKKDHRCIRLDFRGHGRSASPDDGYDLDTQTEDFVQLMRALKCAPCHLVGFSMGGMVALRVAIKYPELIKSLILIDTSSEPEAKKEMMRNRAMLFIAKHIGLKPIANKVLHMFFGKTFLNDPARKELRTIWKNHFLANNREGIVKAVEGVLYREGVTDKIGEIQHPTTILVGEHDQLTDLDKAEIIQSNILHASLKIIPRAGHMSPVEEPDIVNSLIERHLKSILP
ncbi:MAG: alpha/beta hydrolase [Saprospiraceae bacterium]|nr:alpha/beta hydrolase [Saprospiraceae bacterium]